MPRPSPALPTRLVERARRQDGLITRTQALAAGVPTPIIDGRLRSGRWQRVLPEVYATGPGSSTATQFIRAVWMWAGPGAVIEEAAALVWQGRTAQPLTEVTVSAGRNLRSPAAAWPVRARRHTVAPYWWVRWNEIHTVRTEYAVAQLLSVQGPALLDEVIRRRWVTVDMVAAAHRSMGSGRGSAIRSRILAAADGGAISEGERLLHRLLRSGGVAGWQANVSVRLGGGIRTGDVVFEAAKLVVEVDGFAFHTDHARFQDDRVRQNAWVAAGWTVLRFTWWSLTEEPDRVIRDIRLTLAQLTNRDPRPPR